MSLLVNFAFSQKHIYILCHFIMILLIYSGEKKSSVLVPTQILFTCYLHKIQEILMSNIHICYGLINSCTYDTISLKFIHKSNQGCLLFKGIEWSADKQLTNQVLGI